MHGISAFQHDITQLLQHLGFSLPALDPQQEVVSLTVDQDFELHLSFLDHTQWLMLTRLSTPHFDPILVLQANQATAQTWQPVLAVDADQRLCCWLRITTGQADLPTLLTAFDALIACSEQWLTGQPAVGYTVSAPGISPTLPRAFPVQEG